MLRKVSIRSQEYKNVNMLKCILTLGTLYTHKISTLEISTHLTQIIGQTISQTKILISNYFIYF